MVWENPQRDGANTMLLVAEHANLIHGADQ